MARFEVDLLDAKLSRMVVRLTDEGVDVVREGVGTPQLKKDVMLNRNNFDKEPPTNDQAVVQSRLNWVGD